FFVMPSRFEPCGLGQLYALRYGTLPIVRATGGLVDTVASYDEARGGGTGFVFHDLDPDSLANTIGWAISTWYDRPAHIEAMRRRAMPEDHPWERAARESVGPYLVASGGGRGPAFPGAVPMERIDPVREESSEPSAPTTPRPSHDHPSRASGGSRRARPQPPQRVARRAPK